MLSWKTSGTVPVGRCAAGSLKAVEAHPPKATASPNQSKQSSGVPSGSMDRLRAHFRALEEYLLAQSAVAGILGSSTAIGTARELIVNNYLAHHLPQRISVVSGEVGDAGDRTSGELDTVLRDHDSAAFGIAGQGFYPVEAVPGVIEVKSTLSGREIERTLRKGTRVKRMLRLPHQGLYEPALPGVRVDVPPQRTAYYVVAFSGSKWATILKSVSANPSWYDGDYLTYGPEVIVILGKGALYKNDGEVFGIRYTQPESLVLGPDAPGLELLTMHIAERLRRYGLLNYQLTGYIEKPPGYG